MAAPSREWRVLGNRAPVALEENLWQVRGPVPGRPRLRRVMTVARMSDGRLAVHGAICLGDAEMQQLEGWGAPALLVVPGSGHHLDAPAWKARYPAMGVYCPDGVRASVERVVPVDGGLSELPPDGAVEAEILAGTGAREGVLRVASARGVTLVFNELLSNPPAARGPRSWWARIAAGAGGPGIPPLARIRLVRDRTALAAHLERLAGTPRLRRLVPAHGADLTEDPAGVLRVLATRL